MEYNAKNPAIKRILREVKDMEKNPSPHYIAKPTEENLFDWHFTIVGPTETDFEGGRYHGRIILPPEYPFKPPSIILLTPNGRFQLHTKICLSITGYHPEFWQPAWSIATVLTALISFFPAPAEGALGSLDTPSSTRCSLAKKSLEFSCSICGDKMSDVQFAPTSEPPKLSDADQEFLSLVAFKPEAPKAEPSSSTSIPPPATTVSASPPPSVPPSSSPSTTPVAPASSPAVAPASPPIPAASPPPPAFVPASTPTSVVAHPPPNTFLLDSLIALAVAAILYLLFLR